jgi:hypothetical protein
VEYLTESELVHIVEAIEAGTYDALDNRTDGALDLDPLGDDLQVGRRIAEGFSIINSSTN